VETGLPKIKIYLKSLIDRHCRRVYYPTKLHKTTDVDERIWTKQFCKRAGFSQQMNQNKAVFRAIRGAESLGTMTLQPSLP
jgi:hypothetical protein